MIKTDPTPNNHTQKHHYQIKGGETTHKLTT